MIDVCLRREGTGTDAHGAFRRGAQRAMDVRSAVQARPHRHIERLIENPAQLRGRQRFAAKAQRADTTTVIAVAEDLVTLRLLQALPETLDQLDFVGMDALQSLLLHIAKTLDKSGDA